MQFGVEISVGPIRISHEIPIVITWGGPKPYTQ